MGKNHQTPEQMLISRFDLLEALERPDSSRVQEQIIWDTSMIGIEENPTLERINFAVMGKYAIFASKAKKSSMRLYYRGQPRISWAINVMPANTVITGGKADTIEQAMRLGEIAYRRIYGQEYFGSH